MSAPSLTVVTIGRNNLSGYQRTLESLGRQSLANVQHVIIDGASTDGGPEWVESHLVCSLNVLISEPDRGIYDAMSKGLDHATGELICFMNAGDLFGSPTVVQQVLNSHSSAHWRWAIGRGQLETQEGRPLARVHRETYRWWRQTYWHYTICHQAVYMETDFLRGLGGFDQRLTISADYGVVMKAGRTARPHVFDEVLARVLNGGVSDLRPRDTRMEEHQARVEVLQLRPVARRFDRAWQRMLITKADAKRRLRSALRPLVGRKGRRHAAETKCALPKG